MPRWLPALIAVGLTASGDASRADPAAAPGPTRLDAGLDADTLYERVLANRFRSSLSELAMVSGDRGERELPIRLWMLWHRYGEGTAEARKGIQSRTLVRYVEPADVRGTGYLVIQKQGAPDDQFIHLPSMRRTRRVSLRSSGIVGTDFSAEDVIPREMDDAEYTRMADADVDGTPCYVIEAVPRPHTDSQYSKFRIYVEAAHYVPLRTRYWDAAEVEIKDLRADPASIRKIDGVWLPTESTMRHLLNQTWTRLRVERLAPNAEIPKRWFSQRQLETRRMRLPAELEAAAETLD